MQVTKATIKRNGMEIKVVYTGGCTYFVTIDGVAIECCGNLSEAVSLANRTAELGRTELNLRKAYAQ